MADVKQNTDDMETFTDPRDGQTYKTVKIGSQIWMAENLNYKFVDSRCVDGDTENNKKYGRRYTWKAAKVARPDGWHRPSKKEWDALEKFVADTLFRGDKDYVGYALKAKKGWKDGGNGSDAFGFGALPAGRSHGVGGVVLEYADFWSATEDGARSAFYRSLSDAGTGLYSRVSLKDYALSVRCVKDSEDPAT